MIKKILLTSLLIVGTIASACWFTADNYLGHYIARVNTAYTFYCADFHPELIPVFDGNPIACPPAGTQDLPAQIWIKLEPRLTGGAVQESLLQYKKLPSGNWVTFKHLKTVAAGGTANWTIDFTKPVQLLGPNIFDPPGAVTGDQYLVRLYFYDGAFENADLATDTSGLWNDTTWRNQWVVKITISNKRRPGL